MRLQSILLLLAGVAIGGAVWAQTAPNPIDSNTKVTTSTLPTTPQEIWNRILILLDRKGGFVSKQDVEDVLGMHFTHTEKDGDKRELGSQYLHTFKQDVPGLGVLEVGLFEDPKHIQISVGWGAQNADRPDCPNLRQAIEDLKPLGWETFQSKPVPSSPVLEFYTTRDIAESQKPGGKSLIMPGISELHVRVPYGSSQCVVGYFSLIYP